MNFYAELEKEGAKEIVQSFVESLKASYQLLIEDVYVYLDDYHTNKRKALIRELSNLNGIYINYSHIN